MENQTERESYNYLLYKAGYYEGKDMAIMKEPWKEEDFISMYQFGLRDGYHDFEGKSIDDLEHWIQTSREEREELLFAKYLKSSENYHGETVYYQPDAIRK